MWRGPPLADLAYESFAQAEIARLEELPPRGARGPDRGGSRPRPPSTSSSAELRSARRARSPCASARGPAHARALPLGTAGGGARGLPRTPAGRWSTSWASSPAGSCRSSSEAILSHDPELDLAAVVPEPGAEAGRAAMFVGRERELGELLRGLEDAVARPRVALPGRRRAGHRQEPPRGGAGRTRQARGARVLVGRCWEAGGAPAYWPWVQSLRAYIGERDPDALRDELGAGAAPLAQLLPELRDSSPDSRSRPRSTPRRLASASSTPWPRSSTRAAAGRPIVLVLDDLHAADEPSLLLLRFVARELGDSRLLVVGAYRDVDPTLSDPLAATLGELAGERTTRRLALRGLRRAGRGRVHRR